MNVCIVTEACLSKTHGTGAQLLRLFEGQDINFWHFYFQTENHGFSDTSNSFLIADPPKAAWLQKMPMRQVRSALGLTWWPRGKLNTAMFRKLLRENEVQCDIAYAVVGSERAARHALDVLATLQKPSVVHVMDLFDDNGIAPETMPSMVRVFQNASAILTTTASIQREVCKFVDATVEVIPIGTETYLPTASPPERSQPLRVVTVGQPYRSGCDLLAEALPDIIAEFPNIEFLSMGSYFQKLPQAVKNVCEDYGQVSDESYHKILRSCHLAFLSGPSDLDWAGRFSFPSRSADYLMAGLPIIATVAPGTAAEEVLSPLKFKAIEFVYEASGFVRAIDALTQSRQCWQEASRQARYFAEQQMSLDNVRPRICRVLESVLGSGSYPVQSVPSIR